MKRLVCPACGKLLGMTREPEAAPALSLYCKRCHEAVTPTVEEEDRGAPS